MAFGVHFSDTLAGRTFSQSVTPLGVVIPIYTATSIAGSMPILNPANSGVIVELVSYDINFASTLETFGAVGLMVGACTGLGAAGCSAFAATTPMNGYPFAGLTSKVLSSNTGTVTVTAGVATTPNSGVAGAGWVRSLFNFNLENNVGTAHATGTSTYYFNGTLALPPGTLAYLAGSLATTGLRASSVVWKEYPVASGR